jgi:rod shape-determining protein MreC
MFFDHKGGWMAHVRYYLDATVYPVQRVVSSPARAWDWMRETLATRETLQKQNAELLARENELSLKTQNFEALERENAELRGLKEALPPLAEHYLTAEVVNTDITGLRQRVLINRGARNGVFRGQSVMSSDGLLGQTVRISPWSAELILITDPEHAVPVQIVRTGVNTIAVGTGDTRSLALPYLPANADIRSGDLLVTSGLGGVFPQGYPVARVSDLRRDSAQSATQIRATPLARFDALREVLLVWFNDQNPSAPVSIVAGAQTTGNAAVQAQPAPPLQPLPPPDIARLSPRPEPAPPSSTTSRPNPTSAPTPNTSRPKPTSAPTGGRRTP